MTFYNLRRIFLEERRKFAKVYPKVCDVGFAIRPNPGPTSRSMAYTDGEAVFFYSRAIELPSKNVRALVRHELAHCADMKASEQGADDIAERVTGRKIRYDRRGIQTTGSGRYPRPRGLR